MLCWNVLCYVEMDYAVFGMNRQCYVGVFGKYYVETNG